MNTFKQKRYVVIEESSVIGVFFHIYDSLNDMRVGVPFYFKDAAEKLATRLNLRDENGTE